MTDLPLPSGFAPVQNRYVLPSFVERTSYGIKESNPYNKMFEDRIIFLGVQVDDASANDVMAQLLTLESTDPDRDITMYINSPGGSFTAMTAIYDTMQYVRRDIITVRLGQAASAAAGLLAAGTPGKRMALPHSRVIIHEPATEGGDGQGAGIAIRGREGGAPALADPHPRAGDRGRLRAGLGHRDPGPRDHAHAHPAGGDAVQAL